MPVPVAVTHAAGAGLQGARLTQLQTDGPFARLAAAKEKLDQPAAVANADHQPHKTSPSPREAQPDEAALQSAVVVEGLTFAYPGLGEPSKLHAPNFVHTTYALPGLPHEQMVGPHLACHL